MSNVLTANIRSPCRAPNDVKERLTTTRHTVRKKMSRSPRLACQRDEGAAGQDSRDTARKRRHTKTIASKNPPHWATRVPKATPFRLQCRQKTKNTETRILTTF